MARLPRCACPRYRSSGSELLHHVPDLVRDSVEQVAQFLGVEPDAAVLQAEEWADLAGVADSLEHFPRLVVDDLVKELPRGRALEVGDAVVFRQAHAQQSANQRL